MKLDELQSRGAFVPAKPVPKKVTWSRPEDLGGDEVTFTVHIKRRSCGSMERIFKPDPTDPDRSINALMISGSVIFGGEDGEQMSYEQAYQLEPSLSIALIKAVREVNRVGNTEVKN